MRLGTPTFNKYTSAQEWIADLQHLGYRAAYCPLDAKADTATIQSYATAAKQADIVIAEVGAWSNPIDPREEQRQTALTYCQQQLGLAEEIGAECCVNVAGSMSEFWYGPHPLNLTPETFDLIVETTRKIIDHVKPQRTFYTLETMPWIYPDSTESYLDLIKAIDRPQFAVHFDPVNLISSPQRYYNNRGVIRDFLIRLGPYIKSVHAKDILLTGELTTHLQEVRPGLGTLDYAVLLKTANQINPNLPLLIEHLESEEEYRLSVEYLRTAALNCGELL
jgi:sugar phosphate isomerase/epimerase